MGSMGPIDRPADPPRADPRAADQVEEFVRVVCIETCGPSPARCLYREGLTYNAIPSEAEWLISENLAYPEGDPRPLTNAELAEAEAVAAEAAAKEAEIEAEAAKGLDRAAEAAAKEAAAVALNESRVAALKAARARARAERGE